MGKHAIRLAVVAAILVASSSAVAQIVNVLPDAEAGDNGFSGAFEAPLEWRTGDTSLINVGADLAMSYRANRNLVLMLAGGEYGVQGGERYLAATFEHLRYRRHLSDRIAVEAFGQHSYNEFQRLQLRALLGAGPRFTIARWDTGRFVYGTAYMAEFEEIVSGSEADAGDTEFANRWSNYVQLEFEVDDNLTFSETAFIQPVLTDFEDLRVLSDASMRIDVGSFYIKNSFNLTYDTRVPDGVESLQTELTSAIGVSW